MIVLISIFDTIVNLYKPRIPGQLYQICIKITIFNISRRDKNKERAKSQRLSSFFVVALVRSRTLLNLYAMTDFDKKLIEKASGFRRWDYRNIDVLISIADTEVARKRLTNIRWELYDLVQETL